MAIDIDFGALQDANPFAAYQQGQEVGQKRRQQQARQAAGNIFATDPDKASQLLLSNGDFEGGLAVRKIGAEQRTQKTRSEAAALYAGGDGKGARQKAVELGDTELMAMIDKLDDRQKEALHESETKLAGLGYSLKPLPYEQRKMKLAALAQAATDPEEQKRLLAFDPTDDNITHRLSQSIGVVKMIELGKPVEMDPTKNYFVSDLAGGGGQQPQGAQPNQPTQAAQPGTDGVFGALIAQESGGRAGVLGPQTQYGRAEGMTQMLPATAQGMAQKLGVAWRPDLMRGTTPEAAQYQQQLGRAYFEEGLQKYNGDTQKALMYYHGGPDERLWGPKTRAYAQSVMGRVQGDAQPYQVASNGPTPPPPSMPGYHMVQQGTPKERERWTQRPDGSQQNTLTGEVKGGAKIDNFEREQKLRQQYGQLPQIKDMAQIQSQVRTIGSIAKKAASGQQVTAQDDIALIFSFMKMLDPGSVVREGEFATAQNAAGIPDRMVNWYNSALRGTRLNNNQRKEIFNTATTAMDSYTSSAADQADRYRGLADNYGLSADNITPAIKRPGPRGGPAKPAGPKTQGNGWKVIP